MAVKLSIPGKKEPSSSAPADAGSDYVEVHAAIVASGERGLADERHEIDAEPSDVVELEWEGGIRQWISVEQLRDDLAAVGPMPEGGGLRIPQGHPRARASRGLADWLLKGLRIFRRASPAGAVADVAVSAIVGLFEDALDPAPGVYRWRDAPERSQRIDGEAGLDTDEPILVLLHGTFASVDATFGKLFGTPEWESLRARYGDRVIALQHKTLSVSPIRNAIDLLKVLPAGARLHLLTHSRGGLVGELLCRPGVSSRERDLFADERYATMRAELGELEELLEKKRPRVERFVRVACPARGTTLAGKRLDLYLSIILNLLSLVPVLRGNPIAAFVKKVLLEVARRRTSPEELPGLEAMMPESAFIHLLNQPDEPSSAHLAVIAGDIQPTGILGRLAVLATDLYFLEDHDLVVNTRSMHGGVARRDAVATLLDVGPDVNHFAYFANARTRARAAAWLERGSDDAFTPAPAPVPARSRARFEPRPDRPVLFVVPGIMGSELADGKGRVWVDPVELALGGMGRLEVGDLVVPLQPIPAVYGGLVEYMQRHYEVHELAFDWRLSIRAASRLLADQIVRVANGRRVSILAHSMGGLVARGVLVERRDVWEQVVRGGGRLVMLGTPNLGSYVILRVLAGRETLLRMLSLVDLAHGKKALLDIVSRYTGMLEMLPADMARASQDYFDPQFWHRHGIVSPPQAEDLAAARKFRDDLRNTPVEPDHMLYVAGVAPATPCGVRANGDRELEFEYTGFGDGRVTYELGILKGMRTWYMNAEHGALASTPKAFPALLDLLQRGDTDKLPLSPPIARGDVSPEARAREEQSPLLFPSADDFVAAAMGAAPPAREAPAAFPLRVSVTHGNLHGARHPLAVGHYEGDTIVHAEEALDRQLGGRLAARHRLGLYPGAEGTSEVILDPRASPPGAVVVGLGGVGELTRRRLTEAIAAAARRLALAVLESHGAPSPAGWRSAAFSALLIGSNGRLAIDQCVGAIVEGALQANRLLRREGLWDRVRIDEVELVECYEDRARAAGHVLADLGSSLTLPLGDAERLEPAPELRWVEGARRASPAVRAYEAWWRQIAVRREDDVLNKNDVLQFEVKTDRAVTGQYKVEWSPSVDALLSEAISTTTRASDLAWTLFDLIVPSELKEPLEDVADLSVQVDERAAALPWEMLENRSSPFEQPLAVRKGFLRQLTLDSPLRGREPSGDHALVIGDPAGVEPRLPGAAQEARNVHALLEASGYAVNTAIEAEPDTIVKALFERDYRIVHIAAHGMFKDGERKGVVLGRGETITASMIGQLQCVPPFVFLNCCHLAQLGGRTKVDHPGRLAASLAHELMRKGVRAVVAAGWAVDDGAAKTFAEALYSSLLSGLPFGRAVRIARRETFSKHANTNTWGAYQCYGDPAFILDASLANHRQRPPDPRQFVARGEMLDELDNVMAEARVLPRAGLDVMLNRLSALERVARLRWPDADVLAKLGAAWSELGCFGEAVDAYRDALEKSKPTFPLIMIERLANLEDRYAHQLRRRRPAKRGSDGGPADSKRDRPLEPKLLSADAERRLRWLLELEKTVERHTLLGAARKRAARVADETKRESLLRNALDEYASAVEIAREHAKAHGAAGGLFDPLLNAVAIRLVLDERADLRADIDEATRDATAAESDSPAAYNRIALADAELLRNLANRTLATSLQDVVAAYRRALVAGATPRDVASATDQLEFLIEALGGRHPELALLRESITA